MRFVLLATALLVTPAHAIETVQELLTVCDGGESGNAFKAGQCLGYIDGALSSLGTQRLGQLLVTGDAPVRMYCPLAAMTFGQIRAIFSKYARDNPKYWTYPADVYIELSLKDAFPCPK